jgi:isocitrate dehydrogenase (NAD+)
MLRHLKFHDQADLIQNAILNTIAEGKNRTADLGGSSSTTDFTKAICDHPEECSSATDFTKANCDYL